MQNTKKKTHYQRSRSSTKQMRGSKHHIKCRRLLRGHAYSIYPKICMKCGSMREVQVDHIYPVSSHPCLEFDIQNTQVLCRWCNVKKSNKHVVDYRSSLQKQLAKDRFYSLANDDVLNIKFNKTFVKKESLYARTHRKKLNEREVIRKSKLSEKPKTILRKKAAAPLASESKLSRHL